MHRRSLRAVLVPALAALFFLALLAACSRQRQPKTLAFSPFPMVLPPLQPGEADLRLVPAQRPELAVPTAPADDASPADPREEVYPLNVLVLGLDERENSHEGPGRTDAIMFVSVDMNPSRVTVLSVPRDLWVEIPGYGQERVNAAYRLGELARPGSGPAVACETISNLLGVRVDRYVILNFQAAKQGIDALGGIEIDVPAEIWDFAYPTDDNGVMTVHFAAGKQHLDGERALQYMRIRHGSSDFDRIRRQQQVAEAVRRRLLQPSMLARIPGLVSLLERSVVTNVDLTAAAELGLKLRSLSSSGIVFAAIDEGYVYPWVTAAGAEVLLPNKPAIEGLVAELGLAQEARQAELARGLQVKIYAEQEESTNYASALELLRAAGFTVAPGGVRPNACGHTVVLDYSGTGAGYRVAQVLGLESWQVLELPRPGGVPATLAAEVLLSGP